MMDEPLLIERCIDGDVKAFEGLIERYQSLICAIAYNATGDVAQSEDLAQETFVSAWRNLRSLHDRSKFREWLCGVARNLVRSHYRNASRIPPHDELQDAAPAISDTPHANAVSREEEEILWRELQKIPEPYRETMILYYRQNRSIQEVSDGLGVSEDAVKQRLMRGRKLLREQMAAFVESALERTKPPRHFSAAVIGAITQSVSKYTTAGAAASSFSTGWLSKSILSIFPILLAALSWLVGAAIGAYYQVRWLTKNAKSTREKRLIVKAIVFFVFILFCVNLFSVFLVEQVFRTSLEALLSYIIGMFIVLGGAVFVWNRWFNANRKTIRKEDGSPSLDDWIFHEDGTPVCPNWMLAFSTVMPNAGVLLVPSIFFVLAANDAFGLKLCIALFCAVAIPSAICVLIFPRSFRCVLMASMPIGSVISVLIINYRWSVWKQSPGMETYLTPLSWWLLNGILFAFFCSSIYDLFVFYRSKKRKERGEGSADILSA